MSATSVAAPNGCIISSTICWVLERSHGRRCITWRSIFLSLRLKSFRASARALRIAKSSVPLRPHSGPKATVVCCASCSRTCYLTPGSSRAHQPTPRIEVGASSQTDGPIFYVRDNGAGFDARYAEKLLAGPGFDQALELTEIGILPILKAPPHERHDRFHESLRMQGRIEDELDTIHPMGKADLATRVGGIAHRAKAKRRCGSTRVTTSSTSKGVPFCTKIRRCRLPGCASCRSHTRLSSNRIARHASGPHEPEPPTYAPSCARRSHGFQHEAQDKQARRTGGRARANGQAQNNLHW